MAEDSSASTGAIEIGGLAKSFGNRLVLRGIDLTIKHGESVVIFGPNGAGKTTLIKILATIMKPSAGQVAINGINIKDNAEEARRHIGIVTHQTFLYSNLTGYENLEFYCRMYDIPGHKERILESVAMLGMTARLHDRVYTLSRGMQQRLSIARALLHRPEIILLDEPETGLDQQAVSILWEELQREERQYTVVMTTHNLERGLNLCDRMLILDRGRIVHESPSRGMNLVDLLKTYHENTGVRT
ncbi:heme ABC exporter ATP-binding protein CcmA [Chloroflexota bacterium]